MLTIAVSDLENVMARSFRHLLTFDELSDVYWREEFNCCFDNVVKCGWDLAISYVRNLRSFTFADKVQLNRFISSEMLLYSVCSNCTS